MISGYANLDLDFQYIKENDHLILPETIWQKIKQREIIVIRDGGQTFGWLRFGFFWDLIPIMNLLALEEPYRRKGFGSQLVSFWENEMKRLGYTSVMTTTLADEDAQHFYRKLGMVQKSKELD